MKTICLVFLLIEYFMNDRNSYCIALVPPSVKTPQGDVTGVWKSTSNGRKVESFLGIPFAKPPIGPLRFQDPEPSENWSSIYYGDKEPMPCPQPNMGGEKPYIGNEDCLYLNVFSPDTKEKGKYPVMVFFHGGSFVGGAASSIVFGPDYLLNKDIVLVVSQYRIGMLGFASTEDEEITGNFGLKDQVMALNWIKENIASYGGNPDSVTIFGICSGGASVHYHALSPLSKGLFHRALSMSGKADDPWAISAPSTAKNNLIKCANMLNCSTASSKEIKTCLNQMDVGDLVNIERKFSTEDGIDTMKFTPILEPKLKENFITLDDFSAESTIPFMSGVTSEEGSQKIALFHRFHLGFDEFLKKMEEQFETFAILTMNLEDKIDNPAELAKRMKEFYFKGNIIDKKSIPELVNMYSDGLYYEGEKMAIQRHNGPAYLYIFGYNGEHSLTEIMSGVNFKYGVAHADELQYLFPITHLMPRPNGFIEEDKKTSDQLIKYITNFAIHGNPTPDGSDMKWDMLNKQDGNYLLINGSETMMKKHYLLERDDFWKKSKWNSKLMN